MEYCNSVFMEILMKTLRQVAFEQEHFVFLAKLAIAELMGRVIADHFFVGCAAGRSIEQLIVRL